jgi:hypothetical protein
MYALHEAGLAASTLPIPGLPNPPPGQVDQRAVESTQAGTLEADDHREIVCTAGAAVLRLVRDSAENYAEIATSLDTPDEQTTASGAYLGESIGKGLDVYA